MFTDLGNLLVTLKDLNLIPLGILIYLWLTERNERREIQEYFKELDADTINSLNSVSTALKDLKEALKRDV
jgi:predicted DNA-binding transcriptional regulator